MAAQKPIVCFYVLIFSVLCFGQDLETCSDQLKGCYCTDRYIDCAGAEFSDISEIYPYITPRTYRIHITGGRIRSVPNDAFTSLETSGPLNDVVYLNLSGNNIETVGKTSFQQMPNLKILDLSDNDISINLCDQKNDLSMSLAPLTNIEELYLKHVFSREVTGACDPGNVFPQTIMSKLTKLDMSSNHFDLIGSKMNSFLCDTFSIKMLNLSANSFDRLPVSQCMINLVELDLSRNLISVLSADEIDVLDSLVNLVSLKLGGNPFSCDCYLQDTYNWINKTSVTLDLTEIVCDGQTDDTDLLGKPIKYLQIADFCEEPDIAICYGPGGRVVYLAKSTFIIALTIGMILIISAVTVVVVICRRRRRRQRHQATGNSDVTKSPAYSRMV